jgi:protein-tyrosine phosphatase
MKQVRVLFVCTGNICRSPTAEGVFAHLVRERGFHERIGADSAGIIDYHAGEPPDRRAQETALRHGVDLSGLRARELRREDYKRFHYILGMDREHLRFIERGQPAGHQARIQLFCDFAPNGSPREIPDPYYGGLDRFESVFALVRDASEGLLESIIAEHFDAHAGPHHR